MKTQIDIKKLRDKQLNAGGATAVANHVLAELLDKYPNEPRSHAFMKEDEDE